MAGDYTRMTFDPLRDRAMVLEQQGRVHVDADFNEVVSILERRVRVETRDFTGPAVVPAMLPNSFDIKVTAGKLTIEPGRIYVDGLLAENHGYDATGKLTYEPVWDEPGYKNATPIDKQPYLGSPVPPTVQGNGLVYLDVWQREETYVEDSSMLESALGVDTCTRVQTAWQVKVLDTGEQQITCDNVPNFPSPLSAGRLTSQANQPPAPTDPCAVAPVGGYRGVENRLYRVEIHDGGDANTATFKWSRDNGAVAARVTAVDNPATPQVITVDRLGRDQVLRFHANEWVELLDDTHELDGTPGLMGQVNSTDPTQNTVTLYAPMTGPIDLGRNPRLRRWDQHDGVNANGVIPATPAPVSGFFKLEDGVEVKLELADPAGVFKTGDWWVFAARAATASIEELGVAPPRGIRHHYAKLAVVTGGKVTSDCRVIFPGKCECEDGSCECQACVTPESHKSGALTLQAAIDKVIPTGGRVCVAPGRYDITEPLKIERARSLTVVGAGDATMIAYAGPGPFGILVMDSVEVSLERFALAVDGPPIGVALANTEQARVERCLVLVGLIPDQQPSPHYGDTDVGIGLAGWALRTRLLENVVLATTAVGDLLDATDVPHNGYLISLDLAIVDNLLLGRQAGIDFGIEKVAVASQAPPPLHLGLTRIDENLIIGGESAGIGLAGITSQPKPAGGAGGVGPAPASSAPGLGAFAVAILEVGFGEIAVTENAILVNGYGIAAVPDALRIADNQIVGVSLRQSAGKDGIRLELPRGAAAGQVTISGNHIREFDGAGVATVGAISSLTIRCNRIMDVGNSGIDIHGVAFTTDVTIAENSISRVAVGAIPPTVVQAIWVAMAGDVRVVGNVIREVGSSGWNGNFLIGIEVSICNVGEVSGNMLTEVGPSSGHGGWVIGIGAARYETSLDVHDNNVVLSRGGDGSRDTPVLIGEPDGKLAGLYKAIALAPQFNPIIGFKPVPAGNEQPVDMMKPGMPDLAVRGNSLSANGIESVVLISGAPNVMLAENRCRRLNRKQIRAVVSVEAVGATIVSSNRVEGARVADESVAVELQVDPSAKGFTPHCTVLGNIADGDIDLNGVALADPWAPLNLHA